MFIFYALSIIMGYLKPNVVYIYIYIYVCVGGVNCGASFKDVLLDNNNNNNNNNNKDIFYL